MHPFPWEDFSFGWVNPKKTLALEYSFEPLGYMWILGTINCYSAKSSEISSKARQKAMIFYDKEKLYLRVALGIRGKIGG